MELAFPSIATQERVEKIARDKVYKAEENAPDLALAKTRHFFLLLPLIWECLLASAGFLLVLVHFCFFFALFGWRRRRQWSFRYRCNERPLQLVCARALIAIVYTRKYRSIPSRSSSGDRVLAEEFRSCLWVVNELLLWQYICSRSISAREKKK